ncbi:unnamed protein product, partial [Discosporangium mesarthrocarpum]
LLKFHRRYPYVIIGYGVAGRAALSAILTEDPSAHVLVVDWRSPGEESVESPGATSFVMDDSGRGSSGPPTTMQGATRRKRAGKPGVEFLHGTRATGLDSDAGVVLLDGKGWEGSRVVGFERCLLAVGSHPREIPPGFVDPAAQKTVSLLGLRGGTREQLLAEASGGRGITVVGGSWDALELVALLRESWGLDQKVDSDGGAGTGAGAAAGAGARDSDNGGKGLGASCRLVFPDYAPLDHVLPRYLSAVVLRRLHRKGVVTLSHSSLRWIGAWGKGVDQQTESDGTQGKQDKGNGSGAEGHRPGQGSWGAGSGSGQWEGKLHVLTTHSFDHLDTSMHTTDNVVVAGLDQAPLSSSLGLTGGLEMDRNGAVMVNSELMASSRVWVAGDAASFPSSVLGRSVARSADHAHHSGLVAGHNMAATRSGGSYQRYEHIPAFIAESAPAGIRLAMVGDCSAALTTHGFWWTNQMTGVRRSQTLGRRRGTSRGGSNGDRSDRDKGGGGGSSSPSSRDRTCRVPRHSTRKPRREEGALAAGGGNTGNGADGGVKGAMLWGFPALGSINTSRGILGANEEDGAGAEAGLTPGASSSSSSSAARVARAVDLLREVMLRSQGMEAADLSDDRVMAAWLQGLTDAARTVIGETPLQRIRPLRRSVPGRVSTSTQRSPGHRDELVFENPSKTRANGRGRRLRAAYQAGIDGAALGAVGGAWAPTGMVVPSPASG